MKRKPCDYCAGQSEPGWIETDNNGPIVPCPMCNAEPQIVNGGAVDKMRGRKITNKIGGG